MINKPTPSLRPHAIFALLLVLFTFFMTALISRTVFERLPHLEDEMAYLFQAQVFAHGDIVLPSPVPRRAFWMPFVLDYAPPGADMQRFGKYTPGWPLLLAIGMNLGQAWVINAFFASMTVALVYRLGREVFDDNTGLIAAALVAFSPAALLLNSTLMNHTSVLFFVVLFMYAYWRLEKPSPPARSPSLRLGGEGGKTIHRVPPTKRCPLLWGLTAGFALGMVAISRPLTAVGVAAPFVVWSLVRLGRAFLTLPPAPPPVASLIGGEGEKDGASANLKRRRWNIRGFFVTLRPLVALGTLALIISLAIPLFNYAATGDPMRNLYTMVWDYDRVGFGQGYGRNGHTLEKGLRHARFDLSLLAADLFGWQITPFNLAGDGLNLQIAPFTPELQEHVRTNANYFPVWGISWILLPFGLLVGFRKRWLIVAVWCALTAVALVWTVGQEPARLQDWQFSWAWILAALLWLTLPLVFFMDSRRLAWTWLIACVPLALIVAQMTYWIGSQLYSTRYFFEGLASLVLISAIPLAGLITFINGKSQKIEPSNQKIEPPRRRVSQSDTHRQEESALKAGTESIVPSSEFRVPSEESLSTRRVNEGQGAFQTIAAYVLVYGILALALLHSLYNYSTPRIGALVGFNGITREVIAGVEERRVDDRPVLVLVTGPDFGDDRVRWRALAALNAITSPYFDSEIVVAWNFAPDDPTVRQTILDAFPDRQVIEMQALGNESWFVDEVTGS